MTLVHTDKARWEPEVYNLVRQPDRREIALVGEADIEEQQSCIASTSEEPLAADLVTLAEVGRRCVAEVARKTHEEPQMTETAAADTECYRHRCPNRKHTADSWMTAIGDRPVKAGAADLLR